MSSDRWSIDWVPDHDTSYVRPVGDLIDHAEYDDCPCGPTTEPVPRPDGTVGWVVTHHALDAREATEPDPLKENRP
ncbi:MAG: hypothetical protein AB7G36_10075 [Candidatus Nanopelagicales bacterium]